MECIEDYRWILLLQNLTMYHIDDDDEKFIQRKNTLNTQYYIHAIAD